MKKLIIAVVLLFISSTCFAETYWISPTGEAANLAACSGATPLSGTDACSYDKANGSGVIAGDTVYYRAGNYTIGAATAIVPYNSGSNTTTGRIIFATYSNEVVNFIGNADHSAGININGKSYIKLTGYDGSTSAMNMTFSNMYTYMWIHDGTSAPPYGTGGSYNEIGYIEFKNTNAHFLADGGYRASTIYHNSSYNWIHHCSFHDMGGYTESDIGVGIEIGYDDCGITTNGICSDTTANNVIENNTFYHCGHHCIGLMQYNNVVRNNTIHNEQWYEGADSVWYGYRNTYFHGSYNEDYHHGYNLIEGNRISHGTNNYNTSLGGTALKIGNSNDIVRYNDVYGNAGNAVYLENHSMATTGRVNYNHIYNNTFFANGYGATFPTATNPLTGARGSPPDRTPFYFVSGDGASGRTIFSTSLYGNVVKNNLSWRDYTGATIAHSGMYNSSPAWLFTDCTGYTVCGDTVFANNLTNTDPKFANEGSYGSPAVDTDNVEWYWGVTTPDGSDITGIKTEPTFTLQYGSPAIDYGTYLTQANGSGSSTQTLVVDDAKYFQPGWGKWASGGPSIYADTICIGTTSNCSLITDINYATNTITLTDALSWSDNANVWLKIKSDNIQVLYGSAPDAGAHEYLGYNLILTIDGTGTCTVTSSPSGINSTSSVTYSFNSGTSVTLTASAVGGSTFAGWSGTDCSGSGTCVVTMSAARDGTATCNLSGGTTGAMAVGTTGSVGLSASGTGSITIVP